MAEERETVLVPADKAKLDAIRRRYNNAQMSNDTARKIKRLEVTNNILKVATGLVGVAAVIDWAVLDPVPGVDEAVLTGATALLGLGSSIVTNKIDELANTGTTEMKMDEVRQLTDSMIDVTKKTKTAVKAHQKTSNK